MILKLISVLSLLMATTDAKFFPKGSLTITETGGFLMHLVHPVEFTSLHTCNLTLKGACYN